MKSKKNLQSFSSLTKISQTCSEDDFEYINKLRKANIQQRQQQQQQRQQQQQQQQCSSLNLYFNRNFYCNNYNNSCIQRGFYRINYPLKENDQVSKEINRPYIKSGYLDLTCICSIRASVISTLFRLHNETFNIYTHLIPGIYVFIYILLQWYEIVIHSNREIYYNDDNNNNNNDNFDEIWKNNIRNFIMQIFIISIIACFMCSSIYHIGRCICPYLYHTLFQFDLLGIWFLVVGSFIAGIYVGFECNIFLQQLYLYIFIIALLIMVPIWFIFPKLLSWKIRKFCMVLLISSGIVPAIHWMLISDWINIITYGKGLFLMFSFYGLGFIFFHFNIPERWKPGHFDIWGHSHQWWHICTTIAALSWWYSLEQFILYRKFPTCM